MSPDDPWGPSFGGPLRTRAFIRAALSAGADVVSVYGTSQPATQSRDEDGCLRVAVEFVPLGERRVPGFVKRAKRYLLPLPTVAGARSAAMSDAIKDHGPFDLVVVQQLRTAPYLDDAPGAKLWFDQTDLWSAFARREADNRVGPGRLTARRQADAFERAELSWARKAAVTSAAGYSDAAALSTASGIPVRYMPTPVMTTSLRAPEPTSGKKVAGFFANFDYWPNRDAYDVLRDHWAPRLRALGWDVCVAGYGSDALPPAEGIRLLGALESPGVFYEQVTLTLAPLRLGGGVKVKVLESIAAGRPVLATPESVDGLPPEVSERIAQDRAVEPSFAALADGAIPELDRELPRLLEVFGDAGFAQQFKDALKEASID